INAQARKLQRNRAKGTLTLPRSSNSSFCRSLSETSLNQLGLGDEPKRYYSTLPGPLRGRDAASSGRRKEDGGQGGVKHSLYQSPHLLLLQGYNQQDCLVYLLNREQHTVGQETPSARPNICLFSPDILPLHCRLRRVAAPRRHANSKVEDPGESQRSCVAVEPVLHATVLVNFSRCERSTTLRHGDLLSFGAHYIFLYKDPTGAKPLPAQTLARLRSLGQLYDTGLEEGEGGAQTCKMCGSVLKDRAAQVSSVPAVRRSFKPHLVKPRSAGPAAGGPAAGGPAAGGPLEPGGDDHKLTPAYLLCLCIQHSASTFPPGSFGKLLLKIVRRIQTIAWEKTKELAQKQAQHSQDPASLCLLSISDLIPDLQTIFFWMSNSIEILYFIQQRAPAYTHTIETLQVDSSEPCWKGGVGFPEPVRRVLQVFQNGQELLQSYQVHPEIQAQMFAYLFFFSNVSLFNQLMDKAGGDRRDHMSGRGRNTFIFMRRLLSPPPPPRLHLPLSVCLALSSSPSLSSLSLIDISALVVSMRSKVLQIQACLRMVMEWASRSGLGHLADKFFTKLNSAVSILATPPQQLTQLSWRALSSEHPALKPVQLHRILTQYQLTAEIGPVPSWQPSSEDEAYIYRTVDLLESFENHPPIVLPSGGFRVDLESECVEDSIYRQLLYIRHYLVHTHSNGTNTADWPDVQRELLPPAHSSPRSGGPGEEVTGEPGEDRARERPPGQSHTHSLRRNGTIHHARTANPDPSCLLTPTNTPLSRTVAECKKTNGLISNGLEVELDKGPYGLGMGLIDGLHTPLNAPGIYIRTLIPDGPAASDGRLRIGDRILAVNGTSLIGADYQSAVDLIRLGGGRLRFLVAKSDPDVSEKISASSC
ncbi:hypothetical protein KUCAC02_015251, partial [Chaenocephalus aceratus]